MLKFTGQRIVARAPADLWRLLMDPHVLRRCIPGCEAFDIVAPERFRITIKVSLGLVRGRFHGEAELRDVIEPQSSCLSIHAKGTTGSIQGQTAIRLDPLEGGLQTELSLQSDAQVAGMLATVGAKFFHGAAKSLAEQFLDEIARL